MKENAQREERKVGGVSWMWLKSACKITLGYTSMPLASMSIFQDFLDCSEGNQAPDEPRREGGLLSFA